MIKSTKMLLLGLVAVTLSCGGIEPQTTVDDVSTGCHPEAKNGTFQLSNFRVLKATCTDGSDASGLVERPTEDQITLIWDHDELDNVVCIGSWECYTKWDVRTISGCEAYFGGTITKLTGGNWVTAQLFIKDAYKGYSFVRTASTTYSVEGYDGVCLTEWSMRYTPLN